MNIEEMNPGNLKALVELMLALWPDCSFEEEFERAEKMLLSEKETCFLMTEEGQNIAFIQLNLRTDYVEGATSSPVAYIEGIYVAPAFRNSGIGKQLVLHGEKWGKEKGCSFYASDVELDNLNSIAFHQQLGFKEENRIVCFCK